MLHEKEASDSLLNHAECSCLLPPCMKTNASELVIPLL